MPGHGGLAIVSWGAGRAVAADVADAQVQAHLLERECLP